jgi:5-oxoprolinase (ATP-hydrolysing) subunit A
MPTPLLNIDAGEMDDEPAELYALAHVVNLACGGHAGDDASMERVLRACARSGTAVAAHPSYPDRENFGRSSLPLSPAEIERAVLAQCAALRLAAERTGAPPLYGVKPHGALYHDANRDRAKAEAVVRAASTALGSDITIVGPPAGELAHASRALGLAFAGEAFADRRTRPDGTLIPRGEPGAVIEDPAAAVARARELLATGGFETLCVHGDTRGAVAIARAVRRLLDEQPRSRALGDRAVRIERPPGTDAGAIARAVLAEPGVADVVVTEEHVGVYFDAEPPGAIAIEALRSRLAGIAVVTAKRRIVIAVRYDGADLAAAAATLGLSIDALVALHLGRTYEVKMMGFLPGFAYLGDVDPRLQLPRRAEPRRSVPAQSVAIAGTYTAIYPCASPGGWHLLGTAPAFRPFDIELGDTVRFTRAAS